MMYPIIVGYVNLIIAFVKFFARIVWMIEYRIYLLRI